MSFAGLDVVQLVFVSLTLAYSVNIYSHEPYSLFNYIV